MKNPLGTALAFITIFGSQVLALTENGGRLLSWNTSGGGEPPFSSPYLSLTQYVYRIGINRRI